MSANNRRGKGKSASKAGSSRSAPTQPSRPLNDGMFRRTWAVPETDHEWSMFGRTKADWPITEEEGEELENAHLNYPGTPPNDYSYRNLYPDPNAPSSQVMPAKLKKAVKEANEEIQALGEVWKKNRETQLQKEAVIEESKADLYELRKEVAVLEQTISTEEMLVREIKEEYDVLEDKMNEKREWIIECQNIYPH